MQLEKLNRAIVTSGTMEVARATIKSSRKVFDMFSDQTYQNKPVAIARELVANGIDAHIAAGTPQVPVEVTMPTELEPEFKVKDRGIGMSHDFVMGPFMAYTDGSTKDKSNDQIGGFGIGSKSPFAYTDQFTLRVVKDGILSVYTMFRDEEGIPSVGLQGQTTTDEANGVEVSFPVELDDMEDFRNAAQEALQYFHPLPIVHNGTLTPPDYSHVSSTGKWAMRPSAGPVGVIMGGVRYPVVKESLPYDVRNGKAQPLLDYGIDLTLPIGAAEVAMSREGLSYTERTAKAVETALLDIVDEVAATFSTMFDHHPTKWDAMKALHAEIANLSSGYGYRSTGRTSMLREHAKYKGQSLKTEFDTASRRVWNHKTNQYDWSYPAGFQHGHVWSVVTARRSFSARYAPPKWKAFGSDVSNITPGAYGTVFLDDMETAGKSRQAARVLEYLEKNPTGKTPLVLRSSKPTDKATNDALLSWLGNPPVVRLSSLPEPQRAVSSAKGTGMAVRPKVRMFKFNGERDRHNNEITNLTPGWAKKDRVTEIPYADQPDKGILVVLRSWELTADFRKKMRTGVVKWDELLFVNEGDAGKLKGFQSFEKVFNKRFKKEVAKYPDLPRWLAIADGVDFSVVRKFRPFLPKDHSAFEDTTFGKLVKLYDDNVVPLTEQLRAFAVAADIQPQLPDGFDTDIGAKLDTDHPFAMQVVTLLRWNAVDHKNTQLFLRNL